MKLNSICSLAALLSLFVLCSDLRAQEMPQPSPGATVKQTVGITDIEITYSRPGVKGRTIWGELVPYDELWRAGANMATAISFEHEVMIDGNKVPAGKYALFAIPGESEWTFILNKNWEQAGTGQYKEEEDVARFSAEPIAASMQERLAYSIDPISEEEAQISLHWEKVKAGFLVEIATADLTMTGIKEKIEEAEQAWVMYAQSAQYTLENTGDEELAFEWVGKSLDMNKHYYNTMIKSQMYAHIGDHKTALKTANEALKLGEASGSNAFQSFWKGQIEANIAEWSQK